MGAHELNPTPVEYLPWTHTGMQYASMTNYINIEDVLYSRTSILA